MAEVTERVELGSLVICNALPQPRVPRRRPPHDRPHLRRARDPWHRRRLVREGLRRVRLRLRDRRRPPAPRSRRRCRGSSAGSASSTRRRSLDMPILIGGGGVEGHAEARRPPRATSGTRSATSTRSARRTRSSTSTAPPRAATRRRSSARGTGATGECGRVPRRRREPLRHRHHRQRLGLRPRPAARARAVAGRAVIIDESTAFGARVARAPARGGRGVDDDGHAGRRAAADAGVVPVGGRRVGAHVLMPGARVRNLEANPRVSLNFGGDGGGGDIVVLSGRATLDRDAPPADPGRRLRRQVRRPHPRASGARPSRSPPTYRCPSGSRSTKLRGH